MEIIWIIAISVFLISIFLFWKFTKGHFKKEYGKKIWNHWGSRIFYWQGVIFVGTGVTFFIMFLLKWTNLLTF